MSKPNQNQGGKKIFKYYLRTTSLNILCKVKNNSVPQSQENFRKSWSSFDKMKSLQKQDLPHIKLQKNSDNIYFNPRSRANFFKNLIDSYFTKHQQSLDKISRWDERKSPRNSLITIRKSFSNKSRQHPDKSLNRNFTVANKQLKNNLEILNLNNLKEIQQNGKSKVSIRYRQQNRNHPSLVKQQQQASKQNSQNTIIEQNIIKSSTHNEPSYLQKITEQIDDDFQQQDHHAEELKLQFIQTADSFMRGTSNFSATQRSNYNSNKRKILLFENSISRIYKSSNQNQSQIIKEFKDYIFIERHNKAIAHGATSMWQEYRFDELSLCTDYLYPLKDCLYKIYPNPVSPNNIIIQPNSLHSKLVANHCQQLYFLFRQLIVSQFNNIHSTIANNKITLSNLYLSNDGSRIIIGDWQHSSFRGQYEIREGLFQSRTQPILKCGDEWLVEAEYLAPEILQSVVDYKKNFDLWQRESNVSDVYSLGLAFLEIVTLIPLTMNKLTSVKKKPTFKPRQGLLSTASQSLAKIIECQKRLVKKMSLTLQRQIEQNQYNEKFFSMMLRMIEPSSEKRINFNELIKQVQ